MLFGNNLRTLFLAVDCKHVFLAIENVVVFFFRNFIKKKYTFRIVAYTCVTVMFSNYLLGGGMCSRT